MSVGVMEQYKLEEKIVVYYESIKRRLKKMFATLTHSSFPFFFLFTARMIQVYVVTNDKMASP